MESTQVGKTKADSKVVARRNHCGGTERGLNWAEASQVLMNCLKIILKCCGEDAAIGVIWSKSPRGV